MVVLLATEYQQNQQVLTENKHLMRNIVVKTLQNNLTNKHQNINLSIELFDKNWQGLPYDIKISTDKQWIYPFDFKGLKSAKASALWHDYAFEYTQEGRQADSSMGNQKRLSVLKKLRNAAELNDELRIQSLADEYFALVENYRLSPLEELICGLSFLQISEKTQWSSALVKLYLFNSSPQFKSLTHYFFRENEGMTSEDLKLAYERIVNILELSNVNTDWFTHLSSKLWQEDSSPEPDELNLFDILDNELIYLPVGEELRILVPFSIVLELKAIEEQLKQQGVLDSSDIIRATSIQSHQVTSLSELNFEIERGNWKRQAAAIAYAFYLKLALLIAFVICMLLLAKLMAYQSARKEEFIRLKENFINLVSHELKTPLAAIRLMAETLLKRSRKNLSNKDYPERIVSEIDRLDLTVNNILSLNRIRSGEIQLNLDRTSIAQLFQRTADQILENQQPKIKLNTNVNNELMVSIDPALIELVFINLLTNAVKYCDKEVIEVTLVADGLANSVYFIDNGCGIPKSHWERVFDEFYREKNQSKAQGSGIGLALCRQIMTLHHGGINISESSSAGTSWRLEFAPLLDKD